MDALPREAPPTNAEYFMPKTEIPGKPRLGKFPKDSGLHSSRLADVEKQAKKTPGPGRYVKIDEWGNDKISTGRTNRFSKGPRFVGCADQMVKKKGHMPGPGHYEKKDVALMPINAVSKSLSNMRRVLYGNLSKAGKETYIDRMCKACNLGPPASKYAATSKYAVKRNQLENQIFSLAWKEAKTESRRDPKSKPQSLSPNHYAPNYKSTESRGLVSAFPKEQAANFIDKSVKAKKDGPGPGKYDLIKLERISRGAKFLQVSNMGKGPLAGMM